MSKYIDAEKLKAEIDNRLMSVNLEELGNFGCHRVWAYNDVKDLIASLQKEHPVGDPTCKTCGFYENNCPFIRDKFIPYPSRVCKDYTYSVMKAQEKSEFDLEKEIIRYQREDMDRDTTVRDVARHFYELGLNA